jgi:hypothetical protein
LLTCSELWLLLGLNRLLRLLLRSLRSGLLGLRLRLLRLV